ncbi:thiamine pyrophosphate-dependent dehydrogenase E1 component subunit alpha [Streptomyces sp. SP17BM10]|uniref:thiamine pyrophosphate-dependent dehydrogenase E1 component subunit alpha n=1 Tax=Streptomyces sp. SP17BM10 TaxID=3002530 RepID=UPI002E789DDD|nr:thiamine pyrophosphate-dependent dehydrogenase E1 component subunit alpha [Streptomyces sp. SP17BM10]MEE1784666.1 thiamine pyrophosphate-dependent dehydrogenase E1 component subunit alpha [Streptomyces sp. SP17BM10]
MTIPLTSVEDADLERMLLIRHFEARLLDLFGRGELHGTTHTCLGQEYVPVALEPLLTAEDYVFSNHRGHGHYLARFGDVPGLLAEIMGREGAVCRGVGGSQHILRDRYMSTGVQGESLPVAVGTALHLRRSGSEGLALTYIGDGTWGEGSVYEALNLASLWRLPLLVVVENNGIAQSTPTGQQMAGTIAGRAAAFGVRHHLVTGVDVTRIRGELAPLVARVRAEGEPLVVEFRTHRVGPHSKGDDARPEAERRAAQLNDWYPAYAAAFGVRFSELDARASQRIEDVVADVSARPSSVWEAS